MTFLISSYFSLNIFVVLNFNFSALTVWFFNFWPQIRILRVEILLGHISACLKTSILKFRLLLIYSYFYLKMSSNAFDCFWLLFWSRSCLKSSGRLLGTISTKFRANPTTGVQVILSNLKCCVFCSSFLYQSTQNRPLKTLNRLVLKKTRGNEM